MHKQDTCYKVELFILRAIPFEILKQGGGQNEKKNIWRGINKVSDWIRLVIGPFNSDAPIRVLLLQASYTLMTDAQLKGADGWAKSITSPVSPFFNSAPFRISNEIALSQLMLP